MRERIASNRLNRQVTLRNFTEVFRGTEEPSQARQPMSVDEGAADSNADAVLDRS